MSAGERLCGGCGSAFLLRFSRQQYCVPCSRVRNISIGFTSEETAQLRARFTQCTDDELKILFPYHTLAEILRIAARHGLSNRQRTSNVAAKQRLLDFEMPEGMAVNQVWRRNRAGYADKQYLILDVDAGGATVEDMETGHITFISWQGFNSHHSYSQYLKVSDDPGNAPAIHRKPVSHTARLIYGVS